MEKIFLIKIIYFICKKNSIIKIRLTLSSYQFWLVADFEMELFASENFNFNIVNKLMAKKCMKIQNNLKINN